MRKHNPFFLLLFCSLICAAPAPPETKVVAKVNAGIITSRDLEFRVDQIIPSETFHGNVSEEKRREFREQALTLLIEQELLYQDALAAGMKADRKVVNDRMEGIRARFQSKKEYRRALDDAGITEPKLREMIEKEVLVQQYSDATFTRPAHMSDEELRKYYEGNKSKFLQPPSVRLRVISAREEKKIQEAYRKVTAGEDFGSVAARMSEDDYRIKGGDIGFIHRGRILPKLEEAAFALKKGEISGMLFVENKWYILKAEDSSPERQISFEDTKEKLKRELEKKRAAELKEGRLTQLRQQSKIEILLETKE